jgi:hypothetical protein
MIRIGFNADPDPGFYLNSDPDRIQGAKPTRIWIMVRLYCQKKLNFSMEYILKAGKRQKNILTKVQRSV